MTKLEGGDIVVRETGIILHGRVLVVELHRQYINLRLKGKQDSVNLDYEVALACAEKVRARENGIKV